MKTAYIVAAIVISIAMGFTLWAFSSSMTPYVTIEQARQSKRQVQVWGKILRDEARKPQFDIQKNEIRFWIEDKNKDQIEVVYQGAKPEAFDQAPETAALGTIRDGKLYTGHINVKCPSKYEGKESPYKAKNAKTGGSV